MIAVDCSLYMARALRLSPAPEPDASPAAMFTGSVISESKSRAALLTGLTRNLSPSAGVPFMVRVIPPKDRVGLPTGKVPTFSPVCLFVTV
ncbi:hypothetical protein D3C84_982640 [compost metagenome]